MPDVIKFEIRLLLELFQVKHEWSNSIFQQYESNLWFILTIWSRLWAGIHSKGNIQIKGYSIIQSLEVESVNTYLRFTVIVKEIFVTKESMCLYLWLNFL